MRKLLSIPIGCWALIVSVAHGEDIASDGNLPNLDRPKAAALLEDDSFDKESAASVHHHPTGPENATQGKRMWGSTASPSPSHHGEASRHTPQGSDIDMKSPHNHIPFVPAKPVTSGSTDHARLYGFSITSRVYIDPADKLVHFDDNPQNIAVPYRDCSAAGATTSHIQLKDAYFRQALSPSATSWTGTDGRHPLLAVALSPLVLELNSGESRIFAAGDVILLEDVLLPGHRMRSLGGDLKVMYLTLPQDHYQTGKDNVSLKFPRRKVVPCDNDSVSNEYTNKPLTEKALVYNPWTSRRVRLGLLGAIAASFATLAADFLGKTAPLWLAVGVGGTCFVAGTTVGLTIGFDQLITTVEIYLERRKLGKPLKDPFAEASSE